MIVKSGVLKDRAVVLDLKDHQRALVWIDGRFSDVLEPGLYAYWIGAQDVRVEIHDARHVRFQHADLPVITRTTAAHRLLDICSIDRDCAGVLFIDGRYVETVGPGLYAFWKGSAEAKLLELAVREDEVISQNR